MFTRVLECTPQPDKVQELINTINKNILPVLRKHPDFVDLITLVPTERTEHPRHMTIAFWKTQQAAEEYHKKDFPKVLETVRPFLIDTPTVTLFTVETSTFHKIAVAA